MQLSVATTSHPVPILVNEQTPVFAATVNAPSTPHEEMIGFWESSTIISKVHTEVFPDPSVTVHVTVVVPKLKTTLFKLVPVPDVAPVNS